MIGKLLVLFLASAEAFTVPAHARSLCVAKPTLHRPGVSQRRSVAQRPRASVQMGLFGLGIPEIAVILGIAGFVLGPDKLASMAKDLGKVAGELKEVPKEFAEGLKESEGAAAATTEESTNATKTSES